MLHLTSGVSLSGHANKWGNWQVVRKEMFVKLLFCHHCVRSDTRREWKQDAFAPERRGTSSRTRLTLSGRAKDGKHSECGVASFLSWILYTQYVPLLPTPKTDLFSPCLQSMRWTTLTWRTPRSHTPIHCSLRIWFSFRLLTANSGDPSLRDMPYLDFSSLVLRCAWSGHGNSWPDSRTSVRNPLPLHPLFLTRRLGKSARCEN